MKNCFDAARAAGGTVELSGLGATYKLNTWTAYTPSSGVLRIKGNGAKLLGPASTVVFFTPTTAFDIRGVAFDTWKSAVFRSGRGNSALLMVRFSQETKSPTRL